MNNITPPHAHADAVSRAHELLAQGERLLDQAEYARPRNSCWSPSALIRPQPQPATSWASATLGWSNGKRGVQFLEALRLDRPMPRPTATWETFTEKRDGWGTTQDSSYLEALRHDPEYHIAYHNLGVVYKQQGKISEAASL